MPFMKFNWAEHGNRTARLTLLERGLFDAIRIELWTVVNATMHKEDLKLRLRITPESEEDLGLNRLIALGLLKEDSSGFISDEIQTFEFARAVEKAEKTRESAKSRWAKAERPPEKKQEDQDSADF
jgi:hypothetical protein